MSSMIELTPNSIDVVDEVEIEAMLRAFSEAEMDRWLSNLDLDQTIRLHRSRYHPIYLNLLSVFYERLPIERIREISAECTRASIWSHRSVHYYMAKIPYWSQDELAQSIRIRLDESQIETIESLLGLGKGLILSSFRIGLYSFVPTDLALSGYKVWTPLQEGKYRAMQTDLKRLRALTWPAGTEKAQNIKLLNVLNAEDSGAVFRLARALKRGEIVLMYPDGNSGLDGPWGDKSRTEVDFLGFRLSVKDGAARLAGFGGTPILPLIAVTDSGRAKVVLGPPLVPVVKGTQSSDDYATRTMQELYSFLESFALEFPEQWEACASLHRWRRQSPGAADLVEPTTLHSETAEIRALLEQGKRLRINEQNGIVELAAKESEIWIDVKTLRSVKSPQWASDIFRALSSRDGIDLSWLNKYKALADPDAIWSLLARLRMRDLIGVA